MQLTCLSPFTGTLPDGQEVAYDVGTTIHVKDEDGDYLKRCSADSFEIVSRDAPDPSVAPVAEVEGVSSKGFQDSREPGVLYTAVENEDGTFTLTGVDGVKTVSAEDWEAYFEDAPEEKPKGQHRGQSTGRSR